jgi:two-component system KDP operon response regulator KdpE
MEWALTMVGDWQGSESGCVTNVEVSDQSLMNTEDKKLRVLVVDDHPEVLRFIEIDLRIRGFEITAASSGDEALKLVESPRPDIMLLDLVMSGMDGFEVLETLRMFSQLPVITFSASPGNEQGAMRLGANDFMAKPFQPDEAADRIRTLLSRGQPRRAGPTFLHYPVFRQCEGKR